MSEPTTSAELSALCAAMEAGTLGGREGASPGFAVRLPRAAFEAALEARLARLAPLAAPRAAEGESAAAAARRIFGAGVASALLEEASLACAATLARRLGLRAAGAPRIGAFARAPDGDIRFEVGFAPDDAPGPGAGPLIALPPIGPLERLVAEPGEAEIAAELQALAAARAEWEALPAGHAARPGDLVVCDVVAELPPNLLGNPAAAGAVAGSPGRPPAGWDIVVTEGLRLAILGRASEDGIPCLDLRVTGTPPGRGTFVVFLDRPNAVAARPGEAFSLSARWRLLAGAVPDRAACEAFLNQRSAAGTLRPVAGRLPPPGPGPLAAQAWSRDLATDPTPEVAFVRPGLLIRLAAGTTGPLDMTLRIGLPRLLRGGAAASAAPRPFPEGSARDVAIEVGGPGFLPGLADGLGGIRVGESRDIRAFFPLFGAPPGLAGRELRCAVRATALRRRVVPPVDEALAAACDFVGLDALRADVRSRLREAYAAMSDRRLRADLLARLAAATDLPVPGPRIAAELAWLRRRAEMRAAEGSGEVRRPTDEAALRVAAERRARIGLLLARFAEAEGIAVPDSALEAAMRREAARHPGREAEALAHLRSHPEAREALRARLRAALATDRLLARVRVVERRVAPAVLMDWDPEDTWG
jgi:FKBP-type peptidyl-prolyl cis-trans isomerase (trigger factor)